MAQTSQVSKNQMSIFKSQGSFIVKLGKIHWHTGTVTPLLSLLSYLCLGWLQE